MLCILWVLKIYNEIYLPLYYHTEKLYFLKNPQCPTCSSLLPPVHPWQLLIFLCLSVVLPFLFYYHKQYHFSRATFLSCTQTGVVEMVLGFLLELFLQVIPICTKQSVIVVWCSFNYTITVSVLAIYIEISWYGLQHTDLPDFLKSCIVTVELVLLFWLSLFNSESSWNHVVNWSHSG